MRGAIQTFENLMILMGVGFCLLLFVLAIPATRAFVFETVPQAVLSVEGTQAISEVMLGVDPKSYAEVINDDETRADLIDLWQEIIAETDPEAMADMANGLLTDPNLAGLAVDIIVEMEPEAMLDFWNAVVADPMVTEKLLQAVPFVEEQTICNLAAMINAFAADPGVLERLNCLFGRVEADHLAVIVNGILADEASAALLSDLLRGLDIEPLSELAGTLIADETTADKIVALIGDLDPEPMAKLINDITGDEILVAKLDEVVAGLDSEATAQFLHEFLGSPGNKEFAGRLLGAIEAKGVLADFFNDHDSGVYKGLFGEPEVDDALLDWMWVEISMEYVLTSEKCTATQHLYDNALADLKPVLDWVGPLIGVSDLTMTLAETIAREYEALLIDSYSFARVKDIFFGDIDSFEAYHQEKYPQVYD
jgi:hypothetical protein